MRSAIRTLPPQPPVVIPDPNAPRHLPADPVPGRIDVPDDPSPAPEPSPAPDRPYDD